ncbi:MAG: hypothetical protein AB7F94_15025 [Nitrospira sp.]
MISHLKACLRTVPALLLLLTLGCITPIPVTPEQIASADYGTVPVPPAYQDAIKGYMQEILFDPRTARYRFVGEPQRGYAYLLGRRKPPVFGYLVHVEIDAKNLKSRYTGEQPYRFFIRNETLYPLETSTKVEVVQ